MDFSAYTDLLWGTVLFDLKIIAIIAPFCLAPEVLYLCLKVKLTKSTNKAFQDMSTLMICVLIFFLIKFAVISIPIIKDIAGEHYLSAHGEYTIERYPQTLGSRSVWIIMITDDGERIAIGYPKKGEELIDLPKDGSRGTIWYSKNSSYILDFIPDEPTDGEVAM